MGRCWLCGYVVKVLYAKNRLDLQYYVFHGCNVKFKGMMKCTVVYGKEDFLKRCKISQ